MKRIQKTIDVDSRIEARKTRSTMAYGAYNPTYKINYLPPNLFLPGRLYPPTPAPEPPSDTFYDFAGLIVDPRGTVNIGFRLIDENSTTKLDFGNGSEPVVIVSSDIIESTYAVGIYTMRVSNPTNIDQILILANGIVKSVNLADLTSLEYLNLTNNSILNEISAIPDSLRQLDIPGTAFNTCELAGALFDTLPNIGSGGAVSYTDLSCPSTGICGASQDIECNAIANGWTFSYA
jgi:hypothetical protein